MKLSPRQYAVASLTVATGEKRLAILDRLRTASDPDVSLARRRQCADEATVLVAEGRRFASMLGHVRAAANEPKKISNTMDDAHTHRIDALRGLPAAIDAAEKEASAAISKANRVQTRASERRSLNQTATEKMALAKRLKELKTKLEGSK